MKATSTPFAIGDPFAKDQPRTPAGGEGLDPTIRIAQQGAVIQRVKAAKAQKKQPVQDYDHRKTYYKGDFVRGDKVVMWDRQTTVMGKIRHVYEDNQMLLLEGGTLINRRYVEFMFDRLYDQPQPRKALDDLPYDRPALPNGKIGAFAYRYPQPRKAEKPQRPAVNVLPAGETPIPLPAPCQAGDFVDISEGTGKKEVR